MLQASVTGLEPRRGYILALADKRSGEGTLHSLARFTTNPAGAAIVNVVGPIRQIVQGDVPAERRYLVISEMAGGEPGAVVQLQVE